jgi:hypothetical protein
MRRHPLAIPNVILSEVKDLTAAQHGNQRSILLSSDHKTVTDSVFATAQIRIHNLNLSFRSASPE